jgi:L-fuculose-phosphate aldolase
MTTASLQVHAAEVATACRILEAQGHEHSFLGHVSARQPDDTLLAKPSGLGLAEISPEDVIVLDLDGQQLAGERKPHAEMPIHTRIYRRRDDVGAVVHTHALEVAGLMASAADFLMVNQDSVQFADGVGFYPSAMLVATAERGDEVAEALGRRRAVLLRNHGLVTAGSTVPEAVFLAVSLVNSLRVQAAAGQFGEVSPIPGDEVAAMAKEFAPSYEQRVGSTWAYLCRGLGMGPH